LRLAFERAANEEAIPFYFSFDFYSLVVQPSESSSPPYNLAVMDLAVLCV